MNDLIISAQEIADLLKYDKRNVLDELILSARKTVSAGYKVIIRATHKNAPSEDIKIFKSIEEIDAWVEDIDLLDDINLVTR
jgi:hypothetical protein